MYIPNKFPYIELTRDETDGSRKYNTPDGERLASVTTILGATKPQESIDALENWRKRVGYQKAKEVTETASSRGTRMHKYLELFVINGELNIPGSNPYAKQANAMANEIVKHGLVNCSEYWGVEVNLYYPQVYAGTTDLLGVHKGSPAILDFKQSNRVKKREWIDDYFLQLTSYAQAHNALYGTDIQKGVIMMCTPELEYQEFVIEGDEFKHYSDLWWKRVEQYYTQLL